MEQLALGVEDDESDLTVAEDAQLVGLLHQAELPLGEGDLAVALVTDAGDLDLFPAHLVQEMPAAVVALGSQDVAIAELIGQIGLVSRFHPDQRRSLFQKVWNEK